MKLHLNNKGDTIVEVLLAASILALVLAGTYALSNRASRLNQSSYERSRASNLIQQQAELLRAAKDNIDSPAWNQILAVGENSPYYDCRDINRSYNPQDESDYSTFNIFSLEVDAVGDIVTNTTPINTDSLYYTWINRGTADSGDYHDFRIYTCWPGLGDDEDLVAGAAVRFSR